jgi:RNA polymerase sigma factor (sigma-70 family)
MDEHLTCVEAAVRAHQRRLIALAYSILRSVEMAKDEAQNAFIELARKSCPEIANKEAWLVTVCRHGALKALARGRRTEPLSAAQAEALLDERATADDPAGGDDRIGALLAHLDTLPEKQREVLRLHYVAGLKLAQIATELGASANTIYQAHFAGLASLRRKLAPTPRAQQ